VIVLDAFALIAHFREEPAAEAVRSLLRQGDCVMNTVNLAEVIDQMVRVVGADARTLESALSGLVAGPIDVMSVDEASAWRAATIRARHYHRKERDLSIADCILIATAGPGDTIATGDADVEATAHSEGIDVLRLRAR
jgi:PIN domain nuclease of toxin-antitoxin system